MHVLRSVLLCVEALFALMSSYLLILLGAAAAGRRAQQAAPRPGERLRFAILIPAHDEASGIGATLRGLRALTYPTEAFVIVVIADNCQDRPPQLAATDGATVYERNDLSRR